MTQEPQATDTWRGSWLPAPAAFELNTACALVNRALGHFGCYLVGSSLRTRDYRDVDVRFIMGDDQYDQLFPNGGESTDPMWNLLCTSISTWLAKITGLPVDFQIQKQTRANKMFSGRRDALGLFVGERTGDLCRCGRRVKEPPEAQDDP